MKNNPLITMIVPIYNGDKYLSQCISSILNQDYKNLEILLINDGSTDDSKTIVDEFEKKDARIKGVHKENAGVCAARNTALDMAQGEYICLIDQDDYIASDYVSYLYRLIYENDAEISLTPQATRFTENGFQNIETKDSNVEIWTGEKATIEMLYYKIVISPWNKMFSRNLIEKFSIRFDTDFFGGEGFCFSIECLQRAQRVAIGKQKKYYYRVDNPNSGMTRFSKKVVDSSIKAQKKIKQLLIFNTMEIKIATRYANWHTICDCYNTMVGCNVSKKYPAMYKELMEKCRKEAICTLRANIYPKEKIKGILYFLNPYFTAKIINHFRIRKFTQEI